MPEEQLAINETEDTVRISKLQIFFYLFVVPLIFTLLTSMLIGGALGLVDYGRQISAVQQWAHNLPVVGVWIPEPEEPELSAFEQQRQEIIAQWDWIDETRAALDQQARDLADREKKLAEDVNAFNQIQQAAQSRDRQIAKLVEEYSKMKSENAARIFNELQEISEVTAVEILSRMESDHSNRILAAMDPAKAAKLTQLLRR